MPLAWSQIEQVHRPAPSAPQLGSWLNTERAKVPGGWLVRSYLLQREVDQLPGAAIDVELGVGETMTFVPDPAWSWQV